LKPLFVEAIRQSFKIGCELAKMHGASMTPSTHGASGVRRRRANPKQTGI
jgi:hypothetical protein